MIIAIFAAIMVVICGGGAAWIGYLLHRDGRSWHPGDPLPDVPADAPIRHWQAGRTPGPSGSHAGLAAAGQRAGSR